MIDEKNTQFSEFTAHMDVNHIKVTEKLVIIR